MPSAQSQRNAAERRARDLSEVMSQIGAVRPLREIAQELTERGVPTNRGGAWHAASVARLLRRLGMAPGIEIGAVARSLPPQSIDAVVCSPPYALQRSRHYGGISEEDYPAWTVRWMQGLQPALKPHGSIAIVIRPHVRDGQISDYVLRTRLAVREAGFVECDELVWIKSTAPPLGNNRRPRRAWESILWFSLTPNPFCDAKANGNESKRLGLQSRKARGGVKGVTLPGGIKAGVARCPDFVMVGTGANNRAAYNTHPAQYPPGLAEWIIRLLCPPGGTVCDPFLGSGTTAIAAHALGRRFVGGDISEDYVEIAQKRLQGR